MAHAGLYAWLWQVQAPGKTRGDRRRAFRNNARTA
jgi:hypothetical protein